MGKVAVDHVVSKHQFECSHDHNCVLITQFVLPLVLIGVCVLISRVCTSGVKVPHSLLDLFYVEIISKMLESYLFPTAFETSLKILAIFSLKYV